MGGKWLTRLLLFAACGIHAQHQSDPFPLPDRSVPLALLNSGAGYFHLLRYNKSAHDITVERRSKANGRMLAFTPLKLDSVNANWFDYEQLDQQLFAVGPLVCYVFERVNNHSRTLFCKLIDTTGHSTGFIRIAAIDRLNNEDFTHIGYRRKGDRRLIVIKTRVNGARASHEVELFDLPARKIVSQQKISGVYITENDIDMSGDSSIVTLLKFRTGSGDSLAVCRWGPRGDKKCYGIETPAGFTFKSGILHLDGERVAVTGIGAAEHNKDISGYFFQVLLGFPSLEIAGGAWTPYSESVNAQLTFYDGPVREPHFKMHRLLSAWPETRGMRALFARSEAGFDKEFLYVRFDSMGRVTEQTVVPRKIMVFQNRTAFRHVATPMVSDCGDGLLITTLESPSNFALQPPFNYRKFDKETGLWNSGIVSYRTDATLGWRKALVHRNSSYDLVPVPYDANGKCQQIYYLNNGKFEKFLIGKD